MATWFTDEPVPYAQRLSFWQRTKARLEERARERREQEARENMDISRWLAEKAPTRGEEMAQQVIDFVVHGNIGSSDLHRILERHPAPISSARRMPTRDAVIEKIRSHTVEIEPVLTVEDMIVAHRNGATALERPMTIDEQVESPVWEELVERMWDPTHERGPRERDWVRQQHKRQQPTSQSRAQRKGKR